MLIVTAKITRFNVGIALASNKTPCYLRVKVLDYRNEVIPKVMVTYKTGVANSTSLAGFQSRTDHVTTSHTPINGMCIPTGCHENGVISAYHPGEGLRLLKPEIPPEGMGQVVEEQISTFNLKSSENSSALVSSYFQTKQECDETRAGLMTYTFRDVIGNQVNTLPQMGELASWTINVQNHVIRTFASASPSTAEFVKFCHFKLKLKLKPTFFRRNNVTQPATVLESVTFMGNETLEGDQSSQQMSILGWRHITIDSPRRDDVITSDGSVIRLLCVDYKCSDSRVYAQKRPSVYVKVVHLTDSQFSRTEPDCEFTPSDPSIRHEETPNRKNGGYIKFKSALFDGRSLLESKRACAASGNKNFSATFVCK